jgi:uncharacterized protein YutE (UPF0331/DUF86 family)
MDQERIEQKIGSRFQLLMQQGQNLIRGLPKDHHQRYVLPDDTQAYQAWLLSASNLVSLVAPPNSYLRLECNRIMEHDDLKFGVPVVVIRKMFGLLDSAEDEWDEGLLQEIEYIVAAETFDDFLDRAREYHKGNRKIEAGVLGSAVLEDTVKKIARKNGLESEKKGLEQLIDELVKANVLTNVKAKRVKAYAALRNQAYHAEWEQFDIQDVGDLIKGTRELVEEFLQG